MLVCVACHSSPSTGSDAAQSVAPTLDEIVAACEIDQACAIGASQANDVNDCLRYWTRGEPLLRPSWVHCMAAARGSCAMARACVGQQIQSSTTCSPGAKTCNGDQLSECIGTLGNALELLTDCTASDEGPVQNHCLMSGSAAACGIGPCTTETCQGTVGVRCQGPFAQGFDCATDGYTCVMVSRSECGGTGPACTAGPPSVDGNSIVGCTYGFEHRVDCGAAVPGGTVQPSATGTGLYCGLGTACAPGASPPGGGCNGNNLTVCAFGQVTTIDCTALGYTGCDGGNRCKPASFY